MTKSYDIYTDLYLCCMYVIYVCMMLKIHADISICICMYDLINTGTYEHSGSLMLVDSGSRADTPPGPPSGRGPAGSNQPLLIDTGLGPQC